MDPSHHLSEPQLSYLSMGPTIAPPSLGFFFFKLIYLIYLYLAALGLRCCTQAFSSCGEWRLLFTAVRGLLIAVASCVAEHGF